MPNELKTSDIKIFAEQHPPRQAGFSADDAIAAISKQHPPRQAVKTADDFARLVSEQSAGGRVR